MNLSIPQLCSILLHSAAGFCIFLVLLNRSLILMRDGKAKVPVVLLVLGALMGGSAVAGIVLYRPPWIFVPVAILCLIVAGEVRRAVIRRSCAGSRPLDSIPHAVSLSNPVTTTDVTIHRYEVRHSHWKGLRLRIAHLTDLHVDPRLPVDYYRRVLHLAEEMAPDLAVITGDFVTKRDFLPMLRQVLRPIAGAETFAVLGNHDYWAGPKAISEVVMESGIRLLTNESAAVTVNGREVVITGYDYPWGAVDRVIPSPAQGTLHMVLSHTPDNIYRLSDFSADIVFSGHYHAGQIRIPFLGSIVVPSVYGRRFDHGHFLIKGTHLFVAAGIGASNPPIRIYCQPDIFVVDVFGI